MTNKFDKEHILDAIRSQPSGKEKIERAQRIVNNLRASGVKLHTYELRHPFSGEVQPVAKPKKVFKVDRRKG